MNLDELLKSIREEGKKESALSSNSSTVNTEDEKLVEETIDPEVLKALGIDFTGDLTYGEYITLLKEKMAAQRMKGGGDSGAADAVFKEFKRVQRKDKGQKFKVKKTKIKASSIKPKPASSPSSGKVSTSKLLPGSGQKMLPGADDADTDTGTKKRKSRKKGDPLLKEVTIIKKTTIKIADILKKQGELGKTRAEKSRIAAGKAKKKGREKELEGASSGIGDAVENVTKPLSNIFDTIKRFLLFTLLGSVLGSLMKIIQNPRKLLQPIQDIVDNVVGFFNNILNFINDNLIAPINFVITQIQNGLNFFVDRINSVLSLIPGSPQIEKIELPKIPDIPELEGPDLTGEKEEAKKAEETTPIPQDGADGEDGEDAPTPKPPEISPKVETPDVKPPEPPEPKEQQEPKEKPEPKEQPEVKTMSGGGIINELIAMNKGGAVKKEDKGELSVDVSSKLAAEGGKVDKKTGVNITGLGPDTQLTALKPGEVVLTPETAQGLGVDNLLAVNKAYGGTNKAQKAKLTDISLMSGGGIVAGAKRVLGKGRGVGDQCANTTRAALSAAGHPAATKRTQVGDLDTPKGTGYNAPSFAASFGGTDMGKVITNKSQIKAGDIILWRADRDKGGNINKGAITHVGIAADDGLKHQYDHNTSNGFHYRPHWHASAGTSWFAGIRLGGSGGSVPPDISDESGGDSYGAPQPGDGRSSMSNADISKAMSSPALMGDFGSKEGSLKQAPGAPAKKSPTVLPLPMGNNKQPSMGGGTSSGGGTPPVSFPSLNPGEAGRRSAVKSILGIMG